MNPHFDPVDSWEAAEERLGFRPRVPRGPGVELVSLHIHVMDHRKRRLPPSRQTLEAHFGDFVLSQSRPGRREARKQALRVRYGAHADTVYVAGQEGRRYELGPEPDPDDIDPRPPAVVTWSEGDRFFLLASGRWEADALFDVAMSMFAEDGPR